MKPDPVVIHDGKGGAPGWRRGWLLCSLAAGLMAGQPEGRAASLQEQYFTERSGSGRFERMDDWVPPQCTWLPMEVDNDFLGVFRMEPVELGQEINSLLDLSAQKEAAAIEMVDGAGSSAVGEEGLKLRNSAITGYKSQALGLGACSYASNGVQGAALRLGGGNSRLQLPDYSQKVSFTVQAWFKPERLGGTLMSLPVGLDSKDAWVMALVLTPEGKVALLSNGKKIAETELTLKVGEFSQVAFVFREGNPRWYILPDAWVFINGRPQIRLDRKEAARILNLSSPLLIGNSPDGTTPFVGLVDEVGVSRIPRHFLDYEQANCDPLGRRVVQKDWPVTRGLDELLLDASLDGTPAGAGAVKSSVIPAAAKGWYVPGMRGQGLVVNKAEGVRWEPTETWNAGQGTLEFWFMPYDWENNRTSVSNSPDLAIATKNTPIFQLMVQPDGRTNVQPFLSLMIDKFEGYLLHPLMPGVWHHAMVTWQGPDVRLHLDGQPYTEFSVNHVVYMLRTATDVKPASCRIAALNFGAFPERKNMNFGSTVIDEVKLYKNRLTPMEVSNAYQRFLADGQCVPLSPCYFRASVNQPRHKLFATVDLLTPEARKAEKMDLEIVRAGQPDEVIHVRKDVSLEGSSARVDVVDPRIEFGNYRFKFAFKDAAGKVVKTVEEAYAYPRPAWLDSTVGLHEGDVMPPWTPMEYRDGVVGCWGREMTVGGAGWPVHIMSQGKPVLAAEPEIRLVTDQGEITLKPAGAQPKLVRKQAGVIETEGIASGGGWTMTTGLRTEFDGFMKLQSRFEGPTNATVKELRIRFPLQFADEQLFGFYTGERWFRSAHDFRMLPQPVGLGRAGSPLPAAEAQEEKDGGQGTGRPTQTRNGSDEIVFASNKTGRRHPADWAGKVSFLPYVTVGDDERSFCWLSENDKYWTQSWTNPAITISRSRGGKTWLNLNIIQSPRSLKEPLVYTFGLQATPIRPLAPDCREARDKFWFGQVSGFNGTYLQGKYENHLAFRLAPKNLDWSYPESVAKRYRGGDERNPKRPLLLYLDRTWQQAPEDAQEYNYDWRGWGGGTRYTKVVRDGYAWYVNEWLRRGLVDGLYIDDACIDPTFALNWHSEPGDHLAYKKEAGGVERGFEFFDYRDLLKRIRWLFLDNQIRPNIVMHTTQTPYYPIYGFADLLVEGEDRYLSAEGEARDFITSWGLPRIRYANAAKWGVPVYWLPILSSSVPLKPAGLPVFRWYYQQNRAHVASLLLHDVGGDFGVYRRDVAAVGCVTGAVRFIGYWDPANPVVSQTSNTYVSVYVGTTNLALVLVNTTTNAANLSFTVDPGKVKALLGSDEFSIRDVDRATIPPPDPTAKGLKLEAEKSLEEFGLEEDSDESKYVMRCIEETDRERDEAHEKAVNPEAFFESHNFRFTNQVLRLLIQKNDYRLLEVSVRANGGVISGGR